MHNPFDSASKTIRRLKPFSKGESGGANRQPGHSAKVNQQERIDSQERIGSQAIQQGRIGSTIHRPK
ncbi:hypothetical protein Taro_014905 [Colocasia esculenta]|uniref:Uncharacterized protein n=1 Tax=Colocasia esculenta TaxID=4460 RepID=A0A843URK4_COLES|nr:hypothetical protein [Colocasia esculenta]